MRLLSLFLFILVITACGDDADEIVIIDYDTPFTLKIGQTAITADSATVRLIGIPSDSRCALNATCVWQGEIVAELEGAHGGVTIPMEIRQSPAQSSLATANFVRFQVELIEANPYPDLNKKNGQIKQEDYELTLVIRTPE